MRTALWTLMAVYAAARVLQVFPGDVPRLAVVVLHVVPPAAFALLHGSRIYGWRGMFAFFGLCLLVGNLFENVGVATGFPFGRYVFTEVMGPKVFAVPVLLGSAYLGMAYLSWTLARLILGRARLALAQSQIFTVPLVAAFVMTAWDLSMDPVWSTILHAWTWNQGGAYFGVPITNFMGWYLNVFVFYQLFALYARGREPKILALSGYWRMAIVFYALSAAGNLLLSIPQNAPSVVSDPAGVLWRVRDITGASAVISLFVMGAFVAIAWARLAEARNK